MIYVFGIDAGGTKTVCQLADAEGRLIAESRGEGANLQAFGELEVEKVLHDVMERALGDRAIVPAAICLGIAGVDRAGDAATVRGILRRIGYKARVLVVNDALVALEAGAPGQPGIVVVAGTGSIVYGRNAAWRAARAGGWGHVLGDEGSGYWMGRLALRAVVREADRRGRETSLTGRVLRHFGVARPQDLIHEIYYGGMRPAAIAVLAAEVQGACEEGDLVALHILETGARELVQSAASVAARLDLQDVAFPVVLAGGIFRAVPRLSAELRRALPEVAPRCEVRELEGEPAQGAVRLALAEAGGGARIPVYVE